MKEKFNNFKNLEFEKFFTGEVIAKGKFDFILSQNCHKKLKSCI